MNYFSSVFLMLGCLSMMNSENLNEEVRESLPMILISDEETETNADEDRKMPTETLSEMYDLVKNISYSKGIYRERKPGKESSEELELRRSLLKKTAVASESDLMMDILQSLNSDENQLDLLQNLEFLVHQYDVAVNFAAKGGIKIITPLLSSLDDEIASAAASVLGAAMQSNPVVQQKAMKHNVVKHLLELLSPDSPVNVLSRRMFALASLLRNAPEAQEEFIAIGGTSKLAEILKSHQMPTNTKLKIINFFNDLAVEQETAEFYLNGRSSDEIEKLKKLFAHEIQSCDICKIVPSFLDLEDYDTHQKIISAMMSLSSVCDKDFKKLSINNRLKKLLKIYDPESDGEDPLYPNIDKELKQILYSDLKALFKLINKENTNKSTAEFKLKTEL